MPLIFKFERFSINVGRITKYLTVFSFFVFFFLSFLKIHVYNNDFWWHLSNGRYIVENGYLPQNDHFTYTTKKEPSVIKSVILKGDWLAEIIFYKVFNLWDFKGIIILRSLLLTSFLLFTFITIKRQGVSDSLALILTVGVFSVAVTFAGERPQLFTFTVFSVVFFLLEDFRISGSKKVFLIPVLMMLLSNIHHGYIVCLLLITVYLFAYISLFVVGKGDRSNFGFLLLLWIFSIAGALINPTGLNMITELFSIAGASSINIVEHMPTFYLYSKKLSRINYSYLIFLIVSLSSLKYLKKIGLVHILLLIVFSTMSFVSVRYLIFYMGISAPILANLIMHLKEEKILEKPIKLLALEEGFLNIITFIIGIFLVFNSIPSFAGYKFKEDTSLAVPKGAADFLGNLQINGNMFNEYGFGGYLIWRLYPEKKVFIDGRNLEPDVFKEYSAIATTAGNWQDMIEKYNISYVVMPPLLPHGEIYPIVENLFDNEDWVLIYNDQLSLIFLKNDLENKSIVEKFAKDKKEGLNTVIIQASARAMKNKINPYYLISLGKVFLKLDRINDAEKAFLMADERDHRNEVVKRWLMTIKEGRKTITK